MRRICVDVECAEEGDGGCADQQISADSGTDMPAIVALTVPCTVATTTSPRDAIAQPSWTPARRPARPQRTPGPRTVTSFANTGTSRSSPLAVSRSYWWTPSADVRVVAAPG